VVSVRHDRLAPRVSDGDGARDPGEARVEMNGAQALMRTFVASGLDVCFTNPGTSEMHFVAALDAVPRMRAVLGLFEGVVTGAADGWARMAGRPAGALLHLGPGLGNGLANLHNARRARTPVVAVVGEHARPHRGLGAPLESDIATVARNVSTWVRTSATAAAVGRDAAEAVAAAQGPPGQVATLLSSGAPRRRPRRSPRPRRCCGPARRRCCCSAARPPRIPRRSRPPTAWLTRREPGC
jgi:hypothetical protein